MIIIYGEEIIFIWGQKKNFSVTVSIDIEILTISELGNPIDLVV